MALNLMKVIDKLVSGIIILFKYLFNDKWQSNYISKRRSENVSVTRKIVVGLE